MAVTAIDTPDDYTAVMHWRTSNNFAHALTWSELKPDLTNLPMLNLWATIAFAFAGLELSSTMGSEIKNPSRNLPRSRRICLAATKWTGAESTRRRRNLKTR